MNSKLTKYIIGAVIVVAFVAYLIFTNEDSSHVAITANPVSPAANGTTTTAATAGTSAGTPPSSGGTTAGAGQYKDGTYTGPVADAFYGNLQVVAVIQGGKLTDVQFPQYPQDGGHSQQVSATALPALKQEAITAQSANVNIVSGATQDSQAFQQSLGAALAQAQ